MSDRTQGFLGEMKQPSYLWPYLLLLVRSLKHPEFRSFVAFSPSMLIDFKAIYIKDLKLKLFGGH